MLLKKGRREKLKTGLTGGVYMEQLGTHILPDSKKAEAGSSKKPILLTRTPGSRSLDKLPY